MTKAKNPIAKELRTSKYRSRTVKNKKVYTRKAKHKDDISCVYEYYDKEERAKVLLP